MFSRNETHERIARINKTRDIVQHMIADACIDRYHAVAYSATEDCAIVHTDCVAVAYLFSMFISTSAPHWNVEYRKGDCTTIYVRRLP